MEHLRTKTDLINLAEAKLPRGYASIARVFHEGTVENLGAFKCMPLIDRPGWILKLTSKHKKVYYLAIMAGSKLEFNVFQVMKIPWKYWEGGKSDNKLYQGDNPLLYKELRDAETTRLNKDAGHTCPDS